PGLPSPSPLSRWGPARRRRSPTGRWCMSRSGRTAGSCGTRLPSPPAGVGRSPSPNRCHSIRLPRCRCARRATRPGRHCARISGFLCPPRRERRGDSTAHSRRERIRGGASGSAPTGYAAIPDTALATVCPACAPRSLVGGSVTLTLSHLVLGALSVSPEHGVAWSVTYRRRDEAGSTRWSNELRSRLAGYVRAPGLGGFGHSVLAVRVVAGGADGPLGTLFRGGGVAPQ